MECGNLSNYLKLINNCDENDPLLSDTELGSRLNQIRLNNVSPHDLDHLCLALNLEQLIRTNEGLARDYRGLAELMGFSLIEVETRFKRSHNPCRSLIDTFTNIKQANRIVTLNDLLKMVERLERFDVIDDILPTLVRLASNCRPTNPSLGAPTNNMLLNNAQESSALTLQIENDSNYRQQPSNILVENLDRLTVDDTANSMTKYDAFICYAPEDGHYALRLINLLQEGSLRVATVDDLLPGHFEHDALVQLIDMRCRKVLIVLTPNFLRSKECEFQTKFASEIAIRSGSPKIIPVLYEPCDPETLPPMIRVVSKIDMTRDHTNPWQLQKLLKSLRYEPSPVTSSIVMPPTYAPTRQVSAQPENSALPLPLPSITLSDRMNYAPRNPTPSEPYVDLMQSEPSSSSITGNMLALDVGGRCLDSTELLDNRQKSSPTPSAKSSSNSTKRLYERLLTAKRKFFGNNSSRCDHHSPSSSSMCPSTSSQAVLLPLTDSSDYLSVVTSSVGKPQSPQPPTFSDD